MSFGEQSSNFDIWSTVLKNCGLVPGQKLVVLSGAASNEQLAQQAVHAARCLNVEVEHVHMDSSSSLRSSTWGNLAPYHTPALRGNRAVIDKLKAADMVVDLIGMDRGGEQKELQEAGTRILLVREPPGTLQRMVPSAADKQRVLKAAELLKPARAMHVTSRAGTAFNARLGEYPLLIQYGMADEPGRWDHWPSALVATWPCEGSANGTIVFDKGDIILPFKEYVRTPIELAIRDGYIRKIEGGFDADYLREYMEMFEDPEAFAVSHIGWGLSPHARWTALGLFDKALTHGMDARSYLGSFMFSTGPNDDAGGPRDTHCHIDMPMRHCSIALDGKTVVDEGRITHISDK